MTHDRQPPGSRRRTLKAVVATLMFAASAALAADQAGYELKPDFATGLPMGEKFGGVSGTLFDAKGNLHVFRRAGNVWVLDRRGRFVRAWGQAMAKTAHGFRIDRFGFIWTTDSAGAVVKKWGPDGKLLMTLGTEGRKGADIDHFNAPTDVLVDAKGDIYVTDGHTLAPGDAPTNFRVMKFDKTGRFIKSWGKRGKGPGEFELPHAIVQDSRGRLLIADGSVNRRIQIFDTEGNYLDQITDVGDPYGLGVSKSDILYVSDHEGGKVSMIDLRTKRLVGRIDGVPDANSVSVDSRGDVYVAATAERYWATPDAPQTLCCLAKFTKR